MHTELGSSQVEVQQRALSWEVGEALGDELARLARRKWRWKRRRRGGGRGGQLVEEEEEEEEAARKYLKVAFIFVPFQFPLPCPPVLPLCVHKLLCLKASLCTSISMQERLCVKASVGSVKASVYKSVFAPLLALCPPLVPLSPPCSRVPAPSPLSLSVPLIKTRTKSLLFFMFSSCSLPLPPLPCSPPVSLFPPCSSN